MSFQENEIGNLLASVGNHEAKGVLLVAMDPHTIYNRPSAHRLFIDVQGSYVSWRMNVNGPFQYLQNSLEPTGLVAKEVLNPDLSTYGYIKTEYGQNVGEPFIGALISFLERHEDVSLRQLFGSTASSFFKTDNSPVPEDTLRDKVRSPLNRFRIFWELLTQKLPIKTYELALSLGVAPFQIGEHLDVLGRGNVITYHAAESEAPVSFFRLSSERPANTPNTYRTSVKLTEEIYDFMLRHSGELVDIQQVTASVVQGGHKKMATVSGVLASLVKQGYLEKGKFGYNVKSEIDLTDNQRLRLADLLTVIDQFQQMNPDWMRRNSEYARNFIADPQRVTSLLLRAKNRSPYVLEREVFAGTVLGVLARYPDITIVQLLEYLKDEHNMVRSKDGTRNILISLARKGSVESIKVKRIHRWRIK
ncbi:hypothetical protein HY384_04155 [Candidatus Daviesbacteria bacterium]|nr:hypothetical protein [Candidatus Daviesbacteria bacterium]